MPIPKFTPRDCWRTPPELREKIRVALGLSFWACDPCASEDVSAHFATQNIRPPEDGRDSACWLRGGAFINPPYGRGHLLPWALAYARRAAQAGPSVLLVPLDPSTEWAHVASDSSDLLVIPDERTRFLPPPGIAESGPRGGTVLFMRGLPEYAHTNLRRAFPRAWIACP